jgi:hypothetical protein
MRALAIVAGVTCVLAVAAWVGYKVVLPRAFVAVGRGAIDSEESVEVLRVRTGPSTLDFNGKPVEAGPHHKYVMVDLRINAPAGKSKLDDFQLVREKVSDLGGGENIGDNMDRDYFYWAYLDASGDPITEVPATQAPFDTRIAFKVPTSVTSGYLFYWGYYWGPVQF